MTQKFSRQGKLCAISWFKCRINVAPKTHNPSQAATHTHTHIDRASKLVNYASNIIKMASTPALRMRNFYLSRNTKSDELNERFGTDRGDHNLCALKYLQ